jgi:hypothetical protein
VRLNHAWQVCETISCTARNPQYGPLSHAFSTVTGNCQASDSGIAASDRRTSVDRWGAQDERFHF